MIEDPWRYRSRPLGAADSDPEADLDRKLDFGHIPLAATVFGEAKPVFAGVTTLEPHELDGYRLWREHKGGTFTTLQVVAVPPTMRQLNNAEEWAAVNPIGYVD